MTGPGPAELPAARLAAGLRGSPTPARIVLADGTDERVLRAAAMLPALGIDPLIIAPAGAGPVPAPVERLDVEALSRGAAGELVAEEAVRRSWPEAVAAARRRDPVYLAAALVRLGLADGAVAGSSRPSGDVIRAALHVIGLAPACTTLSSSFLLVLPSGGRLAVGDCAVVPQPDANELADIATATAETFAALTGEAPAIALLSFSTLGSAEHPTVTVVREATALVRHRRPDLHVDGELQFDAAVAESVALLKAPDSPVAGHANVLIFPNLAAGNIGYKIAQRLGRAEAFGPILQGLHAPMNDLSRGCTAEDVVSVAVITALQAPRQQVTLAVGDPERRHEDVVEPAGK